MKPFLKAVVKFIRTNNLSRTVRRVGKRFVATRFGVVVAVMAITSLSQSRCQIAGEQQRRGIEEEHLG